MIALNFSSAVSHAVDGLVDHDSSVALLHDLVDLMSLGANEERDHAFRDEDDNGEGLLLALLEGSVDISQHSLGALILLLHLDVEHLRDALGTYFAGQVPVCCGH